MIALKVPIPTFFRTSIPQPPIRAMLSIAPLQDVDRKLKTIDSVQEDLRSSHSGLEARITYCLCALDYLFPHKAQITSYTKTLVLEE